MQRDLKKADVLLLLLYPLNPKTSYAALATFQRSSATRQKYKPQDGAALHCAEKKAGIGTQVHVVSGETLGMFL